MNKYRQCMYTVILILTCLVASPFIFKQIWVTSSVKQPKAPKKEPAVSTVEPTSEAATTQQPDETDEKGSAPSETSGQTASQPVTSENVDFSVEDVRKAMQSIILRGFKEMKIPNGATTPDTIGIFITYFQKPLYYYI